MKRLLASILLTVSVISFSAASCNGDPVDPTPTPSVTDVAQKDLKRAIALVDKAFEDYFTGTTMKISRYYNPYTMKRSDETGSVWMYTGAVQAVNAVLTGLKMQKESGTSALYEENFERYTSYLTSLYDNLDYYMGTFTLTSYTQTKEWSVYGVNRAKEKGMAEVEGISNVYDDQEWLVRELIESYKVTGNAAYLEKAEYLTDYILDGWDRCLDDDGNEYGGITWGPGYVTKHSCSNGPMVRALVDLYEVYKNSTDEIEYRYIKSDYSRVKTSAVKSEYYLNFAKAVYAWQKRYLLRGDNGVYDDMMGGVSTSEVPYITVYGERYRQHVNTSKREGPPYSYNSGSMLSGAALLYETTGADEYLDDLKSLCSNSFNYFASLGATREGYYTYAVNGFNCWFNSVLMLGYVDSYACYSGVEPCIKSFQENLDYGYDNFLRSGMLPVNLLVGWSSTTANNDVECLTTFARATDYAVLAQYELDKKN